MMKHLLTALLTLMSLVSLGQNKIQKEINYVRSFRKETNKIIVELGNSPRLCFLQMKNNPNFAKYAALIKPYGQKDYFKSRKLFEIGIEEKTNNIKFLRVLGKIEEEKYKQLQPEFDIAVARATATGEDEKFYDEALKLFNKGKYDAAIDTINKAIVINTLHPDFHELKALCLGNLKRYQQSTDEATFALEMDRSKPELFEIIANNFYLLNDNENAIKNYDKAIEYERENNPRIYHNYIKCLIDVPNPQRAIEVYKLYLYRINELTAPVGYEDNFPSDLEFYAGQAYQQVGDLNTALKIYNRLIVILPNVYGYYAQRGRLYQQKKDWLEAIRDFEVAMKLDTTETILLTNMAQVYQELHDYKKAEGAYLKYINHNPDDAIQISNYGYLLLDAERYKEAQKTFEQSFKIDPQSIDTHVGLILSAYLLGDTKKKKEYIENAKLQFPEIPINTSTLNSLIKTGNYYYSEKIISAWEEAIDQ
ncbi:tetratricopeptide repeat protein [Solitalea lacus]|uniref:tetratricopeptide repeat protein n=1 Tax=Solitalea lacus TaxID=2911172 RepID=UPI001EDA2E29|nr:tetratricopeptide repeat protein [Solitalea lacus]UKJ08592.1 hypothetical protein L2B55_05355 [Solitalea lacus]